MFDPTDATAEPNPIGVVDGLAIDVISDPVVPSNSKTPPVAPRDVNGRRPDDHIVANPRDGRTETGGRLWIRIWDVQQQVAEVRLRRVALELVDLAGAAIVAGRSDHDIRVGRADGGAELCIIRRRRRQGSSGSPAGRRKSCSRHWRRTRKPRRRLARKASCRAPRPPGRCQPPRAMHRTHRRARGWGRRRRGSASRSVG